MSIGETESPYAVLALTSGGTLLGKCIAEQLGADFFPCKGKLRSTLEAVWPNYAGIICIMATGIVVRTLANLLKDKRSDPAVVVCDEKGKFAISLISGHLGGANELARKVAAITGGEEVITTASDVLGRTALDLWARQLNLAVSDNDAFTRIMGKLVDTGSIRVYSRYPLPTLPADLIVSGSPEHADLVLSCFTQPLTQGVRLHPKSLALGIGCKRNTPLEKIENGVVQLFREHNLALQSIRMMASITLKKDEPGLLAFAEKHSLATHFFTSDQLNAVPSIPFSPTVFKVTGAKAVAEPAAMLASGSESLLVDKNKFHGGITIAIAEFPDPFGIQTSN